jgi:hypothetical protein
MVILGIERPSGHQILVYKHSEQARQTPAFSIFFRGTEQSEQKRVTRALLYIYNKSIGTRSQ